LVETNQEIISKHSSIKKWPQGENTFSISLPASHFPKPKVQINVEVTHTRSSSMPGEAQQNSNQTPSVKKPRRKTDHSRNLSASKHKTEAHKNDLRSKTLTPGLIKS